MEMEIYLDNSATTKPYDEVVDYMARIMREDYGNPSSLHDKGLDAEKLIKKARNQVAQAMGCDSEEIIFTSGGTESDNMAIICGARAKRREGNRIITSAVEHPAVLESMKVLEKEGFKVTYLPVDDKGRVSLDDFENAMDDDVVLISMMQVNNELGTIEPVEEIAKKKGKALMHVDMVQGFGKVELSLRNIDLASISAHKIGGLKGAGALYIKKGTNIEPLLVGGGQENGYRSGTENVPSICGLGLASEIATTNRDKKNQRLKELKNAMEQAFTKRLEDVVINSPEDGAPHILNVTFKNTRGEVILHTVEQEGIFISTGSACSSNKNSVSHVIKAIGHSDKDIKGSLRFSFSDENTMDEIDIATEKIIDAVERFRALKGKRK